MPYLSDLGKSDEAASALQADGENPFAKYVEAGPLITIRRGIGTSGEDHC